MAEPGAYRERMYLWAPTHGDPSATGSQPVGQRLVAKMWCQFRPLSGREYLAAQAAQSAIEGVVRTHYRSDITPDTTMWFTWGKKRLDIESVVDVESQRTEFEFRVHEHPQPH
jgi:SPP1 family predicted phage head-tail adaptor